MKLNLFLLGILLLVAIISMANSSSNSQQKEGMIEVIDILPESQEFNGYLFKVSDKYYAADSFIGFCSELEISLDKIDRVELLSSAGTEMEKSKLESIIKQLPEKYRNTITLTTIYLSQK